MRKFVVYLKREALRILPVFVFFFIFFTLINWAEIFLFKKAGMTPFGFIEVAIAAALIAKIVFVLDHFPLIRWFRDPLICNILWRTVLCWVALIIIRILIRFIPFFIGVDNGFEKDVEEFTAHIDWRLFTSIQVYYLMLLFIFEVFNGLVTKIGLKETKRIFFSSTSK